ncbi:MAG: ion transporter [Alphaproteobacteria bacterium]|nr:ion transporter [Alphaproteobacteria bacterium]
MVAKPKSQPKTPSYKNGKLAKNIRNQLFYNDDQRRLTKLVTGLNFDFFIMSIILLDAVIIGFLASGTTGFYFSNGLFLLDRLFMGIFIVEMLLKIYALKKKFFTSGWNIFDLTIVAVSSIPMASSFIVLRTFRLFRLLKYIHHFSKMHNIIEVFISLLPTFVSFLGIFTVFFYVFAIIAMSLYGDVFGSFATLGSSMFTLLQVFTLDGWASTIARPIMLVFPHAWLFFGSVVVFSFLLVVSFITSAILQIMDMKK